MIDFQTYESCLICVYGFYPSGNECKKVSSLCGEHNVQNGDCLTCFGPKFMLFEGKCVDPNCLSVNEQEQCTECVPNFNY